MLRFRRYGRELLRAAAVLLSVVCAGLPLALPSPVAAAPVKAAPTAQTASGTQAQRASRAKSARPKASVRRAQGRNGGRVRPAAPVADDALPSTKPIPAEIAALGSLSVGHPNVGYLLNAVAMPRSAQWVLTVPDHGYGTQETIDGLKLCISAVHEQFPESPAVMLGSISGPRGGRLPPHKSHRTGRDADVYFFRKPGAKWVRAATEQDIDLPRSWALLRCFATQTDVDMILLDQRVQGWLRDYAIGAGEPAQWVRSLFQSSAAPGQRSVLVRHEPGHVAHMHVRFVSAASRRAAARNYERLVQLGLLHESTQASEHRVRKGDTLSSIAQRYKLPVAELKRLNRLSGNLIVVGQRLVVHKPVLLRGVRDPVHVPARRLPREGALSTL